MESESSPRVEERPDGARSLARRLPLWGNYVQRKVRGLVSSIRARRQRRLPSPAKPRRRRWRIAIGVVVAVLAYPVLGTLALWTGLIEALLRSEDVRVEIENPAYTIWPGRIYMRRVGIYVNGDTQFTLQGNQLAVQLRLLPMLERRVHVTKLSARDVQYRMRVQVESTKGIEERLAANPPLPEIPGAKVIRETDAAKTEKRESPWIVEAEGIDVKVTELWFLEYRYLGDGTLRGGFLVGPNVMRVATSVQDLGPGELRFGPKQLIAHNFRGRITAEIPELNPNEHADVGFLDFVTARIALKADIESLRHVSAYIDGIDVTAGKGPFTTDLSLEKGWLGQKSFVRYATDLIRAQGSGFGAASDWKLEMSVPERKTANVLRVSARSGARNAPAESPSSLVPRVVSRAQSSYVSLAGREKRSVTIQIHGHRQDATLKSNQIGSGMALRHARVDLPKIVSNDLDDLDALLPEGNSLRVERGTANASVKLDVDDKYVVRGPLHLNVDGAYFKVAGVQLGGHARAQSVVRFDAKHKNTTLSHFDLRLNDVLMRVGDEDVDHWWMSLFSERMVATQLPLKRYEATIALRAKDAEPILEGLAEKDKLNDLIAKFTSLDDLRAKATVRGAGKTTDVTLESESDVWDIAGRIYRNGKQSRMAIVVGGKAVSLGVASDGKSTALKPFAQRDWLNAQLRTFPKPLAQFAADKP